MQPADAEQTLNFSNPKAASLTPLSEQSIFNRLSHYAVSLRCFFTLFLSCNPSSLSSEIDAGPDAGIVNKFPISQAKIRSDIMAEMKISEIQYWINDDSSIGLPPADAKTVDEIDYEVIGAIRQETSQKNEASLDYQKK